MDFPTKKYNTIYADPPWKFSAELFAREVAEGWGDDA